MKFLRISLILLVSLVPSCTTLEYNYSKGYKDGYATGVLDGIQMTTL